MHLVSIAVAVALAAHKAPAPPADPEALKRTVQVESANVEQSPEDSDAHYRLGLAHLALGDAKKAVAALEPLVKKEPDNLDAVLLLARAYRGAGDADKARALLDRSLLEKPEEPSLHAERAQLARSLDDNSTAIAQYKRALELAPKDPDLAFNLAESLHRAGGHLDEAIAIYKQALALEPEHLGAKVNLGKALADKGLFGEAKETMQAACRMTLADAEAHFNLGVLVMRENDLSSAVTEFERALAMNPRHAPSLNNLGIAWDARGESKKAAEFFRRATQADPSYAEAFFNLGLALMKLDKVPEASKAFEAALKLEPGSSGPYVELGTLYLKQGKRDRAVEAFKKAITLMDQAEKEASGFSLLRKRFNAERTTDAYRGLALAYLGQGKVDDAVGTLKLAVEKLPKDASARVAYGEALQAQGKFDDALEQFKVRLSLQPTTEARLDLARAWAKKRVAKEAEPLYRAILRDEPANRAAKLGIADLYLTMGRYAEEETLLKELLATDAGDAQALARLGILKSRMQRPNEALEPLEKAAELNPLLFDARAELGFLLFRANPQDNADRCVQMMSDILTSESRHVLAWHYLGMCVYAKGDKKKAEEAFKSASTIDPAYSGAHFSLGELYENDGKKDEAKKEYEAAAKLDFAEAKDALKRLGGGK